MDATAVKRVLHGTNNGMAVVGLRATLAALESGEIREWLQTPRFRERHPEMAARAREEERLGRLLVREVSGIAAAQLDLAGDGVAGVLHRPRAQGTEPVSHEPRH